MGEACRMGQVDTICAPATSVGAGAVSVVRVSGPRTFEIIDEMVRFRKGTSSDAKGYSIKYGEIEGVDDVLVSVFKGPHSYTGEDSVEIGCHASTYIVGRIIDLLVARGARMAEPGEFSRRAFLNGKMDLVQAESVADLIMAENEAAHRVARAQMRGGFSAELKVIRAKLLELTSLLELELDFSEEDVEFADRAGLRSLVESSLRRVNALVDSFRLGNAIRRGVPVAIVGATNTGKSTLLNSLVGENRAIVTDIAGTTRDTIEEGVTIGDTLFRLIDTAGIRESDDVVEKIGISRSLEKLSEADIVVGVIDSTRTGKEISDDVRLIIGKVDFSEQNLVLLVNKCDISEGNKNVISTNNLVTLIVNKEIERNRDLRERIFVLNVSAKTGEGLEKVKDTLLSIQKSRIALTVGPDSMVLVTNQRHKNALSAVASSLLRVRDGLDAALPGDLIAQDLREAISHLGEVTGEISTDEVLGEIFGKFCIGK